MSKVASKASLPGAVLWIRAKSRPWGPANSCARSNSDATWSGGAPAPSAPSGSNGFGGGGLYAPAPESSDAYAADSLAADTAALNLLSVGYGDADRRRYAPRQQGYGGY